MCPVPAGGLDAAVEVTNLNPSHGAPVHIGDPGMQHNHYIHTYIKNLPYSSECVNILCTCSPSRHRGPVEA